jgi:hypothetical protein
MLSLNGYVADPAAKPSDCARLAVSASGLAGLALRVSIRIGSSPRPARFWIAIINSQLARQMTSLFRDKTPSQPANSLAGASKIRVRAVTGKASAPITPRRFLFYLRRPLFYAVPCLSMPL